jgi:PAS domain S-box-containing protein
VRDAAGGRCAWRDRRPTSPSSARHRGGAARASAHLALLFGQATVGLSEIAADGRFLRVNAELCRIVGRSLETIATLTVPDVTHPDDVVRSLSAVGSVLAHGGSVRLEKRYLRPDGTTVVAESVITRLEPMPGAEPTLLAVTTDLTAWRAAEAALRESEMRFRQLAENVSEMFWLLDLGPTLEESQVIYMNPAYVRITGRSLDEIHAAPAWGSTRSTPTTGRA